MSKRILILLFIPLVLVLLLFAGLQLWFLSYKVADPALADQVFQRSAAAIDERNRRADREETNGALYLKDPLVVARCTVLSDAKKRKPADFKAFEAGLSELEKELAKPDFLFKVERDRLDSGPDPVVLRGLVGSLAEYARHLASQGKTSQAVRLSLLNLELAGKVMQQGSVVTVMVGVGLERTAAEPLFELLRSGKLKDEDCQEIERRVQAMQLTPEVWLARADEEYAGFLDFIASGKVGPSSSSSVQQLLIMTPGFVARERRIYQRLYLRDRESIEKMKSFEAGGGEVQALGVNEHAFLVATLYPAFDRAQLQFARALTELSALQVMARLERERIRGKKYPAALPGEARDFLAGDGKFAYQSSGKSYTLKSGYNGKEIEAKSLQFR